jgi:hypothetical protein
MANPTSNFGWQMPTNTDLVTDLPADFETFGQAVDTSLADLKGGTTGQVLKKNSNTDMDFVWSADSAGMTNPMTTTGDTIYSSSGSTPARLGIGSTGQVLTVAAGIPSWATPSGGGGLTLISTVTLSGASTTLSSIPGTYKSLVLFGSGIYGSTNGEFVIKINGGTDTWHSYIDASTLSHTAQTAWKVSADKSINTGSLPFSFYGQIDNYAATSPAYKPVQSYGYAYNGSTQSAVSTFGGHRNTSAITSLEFDASGDGTGTILVYGVN